MLCGIAVSLHVYGGDFEQQWSCYNRHGRAWLRQNDYVKAGEYLDSARSLLIDNDARYTGLYVATLTDMAQLYMKSADDEALKEICEECDRLAKVDYNSLSARGARLLRRLAELQIVAGQSEKGASILNRLISSSVKGITPVDEARTLHSLAYAKYCMGDVASAVKFEREALTRAELPESWKALSWYLYEGDEKDSLAQVLSDAFVKVREPALQRFVASTPVERARYWTNAGLFFNRFIPSFAAEDPSPEMNGLAYDALLLSKGMLLNAAVTAEDIIMASGNEDAIATLQRMKELSKLSSPTLEQAAEKDYLQQQLLRRQKQFTNQFRSRLRYSWKEVRQALPSQQSLAVEFMLTSVNGQEVYAALVIDRECQSPRLIRLCTAQELAAVPAAELYTSDELYKLLWEPIFEAYPAVDQIFFAPDGALHTIAVEYCVDSDGMDLASVYGMHRLSSTRQLAAQSVGNGYEKGVLFGGVNYNADGEDPAATVRGGVGYLPATKAEVESIASILQSVGLQQLKFVGDDAREERIATAEVASGDLLHFATHGFYLASPASVSTRSLPSMVYDALITDAESSENYLEDLALNRSGLLLAGANATLTSPSLASADSATDGVLTAREVAAEGLTGVKTVVLSACSSALGDLSHAEGVFGLQRGFKLAGVKSLVMSLWKVNDEATMILMDKLYQNLAMGMPISESLVMARMDLQMADDGRWDSPEFYNAFIALDAPF